DERNKLSSILNRNTAQEDQLAILNDRLNRLGFSFENRDPLYNEFLLAWQDVKYADRLPLSPREAADRREAMNNLIQKLLE
ncbi:hypothetical protein WAH92_23055, partial [Acinetobacter baumannii]